MVVTVEDALSVEIDGMNVDFHRVSELGVGSAFDFVGNREHYWSDDYCAEPLLHMKTSWEVVVLGMLAEEVKWRDVEVVDVGDVGSLVAGLD